MAIATGIAKKVSVKKEAVYGVAPVKGTGTGYTTSALGFASGTTVIPLITGTGTVLAGDTVQFAGDTNFYVVTVGIAAPGSITIASPGLKVAIPAAATAVTITSGAQAYRRVTSNLALAKQTYTSAEIRPDYQVADFRHGVRSITGSINGELSPGTHSLVLAAALRAAYVAGVSATGASITIAGTGPSYTVTRAAGSYLTDGFKIGDVIRLSVGTFNAANINTNLFILGLTATVATVLVLTGLALVPEGPIGTSTVAVVGKKALVPLSGHTNDSFSVEHWHSDIAQSEVFRGCRVSQLDIGLPPTGMATLNTAFMGTDITTAQAQQFTAPNTATTSGVLASVNGVISVGGTQIALLTGLTMKINPNMTQQAVVGSNVFPDTFAGRVMITGQMTALFSDATLRDYFVNETEVSIACAFTTGNTATADVMSFILPRVKCGGSAKDDGEKGLVQTIPFQALLNVNGGAGLASDNTTLSVQDSLA